MNARNMPEHHLRAIQEELTRKTNFRVVVTPVVMRGILTRTQQEVSDERAEATCRDIEDQIRRHVDDFADIEIEHDTVCIFCGSDPEFEDQQEGGEPICCQEAIDAFNDKLTEGKE